MEMYDEIKIFTVDTDIFTSKKSFFELTEEMNYRILDWLQDLKNKGNVDKNKIEIINTETKCDSSIKNGEEILFMTCTIVYKRAYI